MEYFVVDLILPQGTTGIRLDLPATEVFILDDDGKAIPIFFLLLGPTQVKFWALYQNEKCKP